MTRADRGRRGIAPALAIAGYAIVLSCATVTAQDPLIQDKGYSIDELRRRDFPPGDIEVLRKIEDTDTLTAYWVRYKSEGLDISGMMTVPKRGGRLPAVILNHGFYSKSRYRTGIATKDLAYYLSARGYVTVASDYRNLGDSDSGPDVFNHLGSLVDVLSLLESVKRIKEVDPERIGIWGHSQGGWIALKAVAARKGIKAAALFAPMSISDAENYQMVKKWHPDVIGEVTALFGDPSTRRDAYERLSAGGYLGDISTAFSIHHGQSDDVVPLRWSASLRDTLSAAGKSVELFTYAGQKHTFVGSARDQAFAKTAAFFDRYLKDQ